MDKVQANKLLREAQETIAKQFPDFEVKFGRTTFETNGRINFKFSMIDKSAKALVAEKDELDGMIKNGVSVDADKFVFSHNGATYKVETVLKRKQKYPVVARNIDSGKALRFTAKFINEQIAKETGVKFVGWHK